MARAFLALVTVTLGLLFSSPAPAGVSPISQPYWKELTPEQQQILAPLAGEWDKLEAYRRKKWVGIAKRYPAMKPEEQARIQRRMKDWAKLTPDERKAVREQYKDLKKAPPEHKAAIKQKWQEYKGLPDEDKKRLKEQAGTRPALKSAAGKSPLASPLRSAVSPPPTAVPPAPTPATAQ